MEVSLGGGHALQAVGRCGCSDNEAAGGSDMSVKAQAELPQPYSISKTLEANLCHKQQPLLQERLVAV